MHYITHHPQAVTFTTCTHVHIYMYIMYICIPNTHAHIHTEIFLFGSAASQPPKRQIKFPAKSSGYTIFVSTPLFQLCAPFFTPGLAARHGSFEAVSGSVRSSAGGAGGSQLSPAVHPLQWWLPPQGCCSWAAEVQSGWCWAAAQCRLENVAVNTVSMIIVRNIFNIFVYFVFHATR